MQWGLHGILVIFYDFGKDDLKMVFAFEIKGDADGNNFD